MYVVLNLVTFAAVYNNRAKTDCYSPLSLEHMNVFTFAPQFFHPLNFIGLNFYIFFSLLSMSIWWNFTHAVQNAVAFRHIEHDEITDVPINSKSIW